MTSIVTCSPSQWRCTYQLGRDVAAALAGPGFVTGELTSEEAAAQMLRTRRLRLPTLVERYIRNYPAAVVDAISRTGNCGWHSRLDGRPSRADDLQRILWTDKQTRLPG